MPQRMPRKERLEALVRLAMVYHGCSLRRIAKLLGRDTHGLIPEGGVPKLDLVIRLAELLDWPVQMVIDDLCADSTPVENGRAETDWRAMNRRAHELLYAGRPDEASRIAEEVLSGSTLLRDQTSACLILAACLDCTGRYAGAIEIVRRALRLVETNSEQGYALRANLCWFQYLLGDFVDAEGVAMSLAEALRDVERANPLRMLYGFARSVQGHSLRAMAMAARDDLAAHPLAKRAERLLDEAARELDDHELRGGPRREALQAQLARIGGDQMRALLGTMDVERFLASILGSLGDSGELPADLDDADLLAWTCILGCETLLRQVQDAELVDLRMAVLTNKADEVAGRTGNWALRERVFTLEHTRLSGRAAAAERGESGFTYDEEDVRLVAGAMGRFSRFREKGWDLFRLLRQFEEEESR